MAGEHKKPKFWINPKSRLTFPQFRVVWHQCGKQELIDFCSVEQPRRLTYRTVSACLHILYEADYSVFHILYSEEIAFENMRLTVPRWSYPLHHRSLLLISFHPSCHGGLVWSLRKSRPHRQRWGRAQKIRILTFFNLIFNCYPLFVIILGNTLKRQENSQKHCKWTDFYMIDEITHEKPVQREFGIRIA